MCQIYGNVDEYNYVQNYVNHEKVMIICGFRAEITLFLLFLT